MKCGDIMLFREAYKCRLCGEMFVNENMTPISSEIAADRISKYCYYGNLKKDHFSEYICSHKNCDYGYGIGDFAGYKAETN